MNELQLTFCLFMGMSGVAIVALLFSRRLIYAAFLLFVVLLGVAAMYVMSGAEFLAVAQLVVYVGGILILIMFGIMLTQREGAEQAITPVENVMPAVMLGVSLLAVMLFVWNSFRSNPPSWMEEEVAVAELPSNVEQIGTQTLSAYLFPFELMSILLLLALVGAAYLARRGSQATTK